MVVGVVSVICGLDDVYDDGSGKLLLVAFVTPDNEVVRATRTRKDTVARDRQLPCELNFFAAFAFLCGCYGSRQRLIKACHPSPAAAAGRALSEVEGEAGLVPALSKDL
jgi:hypothetical protein